jgi:hypothetical protein
LSVRRILDPIAIIFVKVGRSPTIAATASKIHHVFVSLIRSTRRESKKCSIAVSSPRISKLGGRRIDGTPNADSMRAAAGPSAACRASRGEAAIFAGQKRERVRTSYTMKRIIE